MTKVGKEIPSEIFSLLLAVVIGFLIYLFQQYAWLGFVALILLASKWIIQILYGEYKKWKKKKEDEKLLIEEGRLFWNIVSFIIDNKEYFWRSGYSYSIFNLIGKMKNSQEKAFLHAKLDLLEKWFWSLLFLSGDGKYYYNIFTLPELHHVIKHYTYLLREYSECLQRFINAEKETITPEDEEYYRKFKEKWNELVRRIENIRKKSKQFTYDYPDYLPILPDSLQK